MKVVDYFMSGCLFERQLGYMGKGLSASTARRQMMVLDWLPFSFFGSWDSLVTEHARESRAQHVHYVDTITCVTAASA